MINTSPSSPAEGLERPVTYKYIGGYSLAVISVLVALLLRLLIDPWLGDQSPYVMFVVAVAVTGLYAGVRAAVFSAALGAALAYFCFVPPRYHLGFAGINDAAGFSVYLLASVAVVVLTRARNHAVAVANESLRERITTQEKLLNAEALLKSFMDHSSACAYLRDESGQCVYANETARQVFDIQAESQGDRTNRVANSEFRDQDQQVLRTHRAMQFVQKVVQPDSDRYWLTSKFPFIDVSGQHFVGSISFEITERMRAEEILRRSEKLWSAGQMASLLAHEINNPLAALTNLMFLLREQQLAPEARYFLVQSNDALDRINHITRMTIDFFSDKDAPVPVKVCQIVDEVAHHLAASETFQHICIEREFNTDATVIASPVRFRQLIDNLLSNALESGARRVRVRLQQGRDWHDYGRIGVYITVADDGRGIPREIQQELFDPFFSTKGKKGAGLGLWASRAIVLRSDGRIRIRSRVSSAKKNTGTCVRVFLPTSRESKKSIPRFEDVQSFGT